MLSKKSFGGNKRNFPKLLTRFARSDVRDHIESLEHDHGPSYGDHRASQRRRSSPTVCEIFGVIRFSTFSTASARSVTFGRLADGLLLSRQRRYSGRLSTAAWGQKRKSEAIAAGAISSFWHSCQAKPFNHFRDVYFSTKGYKLLRIGKAHYGIDFTQAPHHCARLSEPPR
jgi:hypothetical protein